jgi:hypothetical protein
MDKPLPVRQPGSLEELESWLDDLLTHLDGEPNQILERMIPLPFAVGPNHSGPGFMTASLFPPDDLHEIRKPLLDSIARFFPSKQAPEFIVALSNAKMLWDFRRELQICRNAIAEAKRVGESQSDKLTAAQEVERHELEESRFREGGIDPKPGSPKPAQKPSINARMLETIQTNPDAIGWSSTQWVNHLLCAKSSVVETHTWKDLQMARVRRRAERAKDRRHNRKPMK